MALRPTIAVLGGTGPEGRGLALRLAAAGRRVVIGSRDVERARRTAAAIGDRVAQLPGAVEPRGMENADAARLADVVVLTVPYAVQSETLETVREAIGGKVLIDVVVPLRPPEVWVVDLPRAGSASAEAQALLGPSVRVVAAFQNVSAALLGDLEAELDCDVLVCGDDPRAKEVALELVDAVGTKGYDAGPLRNAGIVEGLTSILAGINRRHRTTSAGIRITNVTPRPPVDR